MQNNGAINVGVHMHRTGRGGGGGGTDGVDHEGGECEGEGQIVHEEMREHHHHMQVNPHPTN